MGKYLFFIIQILVLFGCKVQSDITRPEQSAELTQGSQFHYYLDDVTLTQNSNPISLDHNLITNGEYVFSITPMLPSGMTINTATGKIFGTPLNSIPRTNFNIFAASAGNVLSTTVAIEVTRQPPGSVYYPSSPLSFNLGVVGTSGTPVTSGGSPDQFGITPTSPSGLNLATLGLVFNSITGVISGTPNQPIQQWMTLTATNPGGTTETQVLLIIRDNAPTSLVYSPSTYTFNVGSASSISSPTIGGSPVSVNYSISPSLPAGLSLNTSTGAITGTPTQSTGNVTYTITASNAEGSASNTITLDINNPTLSIDYGTSLDVYKNTSIGLLTPLYTGGKPISYTVTGQTRPGAEVNNIISGAGGLSLNTTTGKITGAPQTALTEGSYTVTISAQGDGGTPVVTTMTFVVKPEPTSHLNYPLENTFYINQAITTISPNPTGGSVLTYAITPDITTYSGNPTGLNFNTTTGQITGTPTLLMPETTYTVTATNSELQSVNQSFTIKVLELAPNYLGYEDFITNNAASYTFTAGRLLLTQGVSVPTITPEVNSRTIGVPTSYMISPSLPSGLVFNALNGEISGTPTSVSENKSYSIQGTNSGGSFTEILIIEVRAGVPTSISYDSTGDGVNQFTLTVNDNISAVEGEATVETDPAIVPMSFTISPALPSGVSINPSNGNITATAPLESTPNTAYTITATGAGGSTSQVIHIQIDNTALGAGAITYPVTGDFDAGMAGADTLILEQNVLATVTPSTPNYSGGTGGEVVLWQLTGTLPPGLSFDTATGVISGTPTTESLAGEFDLDYVYDSSPATYQFSVRGFKENPGVVGALNDDYVDYSFNIVISSEAPDYYFESPDTGTTRMIAAAGQTDNIVELGVSLFTNGGVVSSTNNGAPYNSCTVSSLLPAYLSLDGSTCRIYPNTPASMCGVNTEYSNTMTFTNSGGVQTSVPFSILVADAPGVYLPNRQGDVNYIDNNLQVFEGSNPFLLTMVPDFGACAAPAGDSYTLNSTLLPAFSFNGSNGYLTSNSGMALRTTIDITGQRTVLGETINKNSEFSSQTNFYTDSATAVNQNTVVFDFNKDNKEDIVIFKSDDISYVKQSHSGVFTRDTTMNAYVSSVVGSGEVIYSAGPMVYANTGASNNHDKGVYFLTQDTGLWYVHGVSANNGSDNGFSAAIAPSTGTPVFATKDMSLYGSSSYASAAYVAYRTVSNIEIKIFNANYSGGLTIDEQETIVINTSSIPASATLRDMVIFDNNGDGFNDIALAFNSGICILRASGSQFTHSTVCETILTEVSEIPYQLKVANVANPLYNREDLVVMSYNSTSSSYHVNVYENDNNFFTLNFTPVISIDTGLTSISASNGKDFFLADHNNDGDLELYVYNPTTATMIRYENYGVAPWLSTTPIQSQNDTNGVALLKYQRTDSTPFNINSTPIYNSSSSKIGTALISCEYSSTSGLASCGLPALFSQFDDL